MPRKHERLRANQEMELILEAVNDVCRLKRTKPYALNTLAQLRDKLL